MKLIAYARQSKTDAASVPSTDWQLSEARSWAEARGHEITETFVDLDTSGYRRVSRPGFDRLLEALHQPGVDGVLVWRLDRLSRQGQWGPDVLRFMDARGDAVLMSVCEDVDTSTAAGEMILGVRLSMARAESESISARWRAQKRRAAEAGQPSSGGPRPFGLRNGEVDPVEAALIRDAADRILDGGSLRSIVLDWREHGILTSSGNDWSAAALRQLLRQWRLAGVVTFHDKVVSTTGPQILTVDTVRRLRAVLDDPARRSVGRPASRLLSGLLYCGRCGARMRGARRNDKLAYACPARPDGCAGIAIGNDPLDDHVKAALATVLPTLPRPEEPDHGPERQILDDLARLDAELEALAEDFASGALTRITYAAAAGAVEQRADRHREALTQHRRQTLRHRALGLPPASVGTLEVDELRPVLAAVIDRIVVGPAVRGRNWFDPTRVTISWRA